MEQDEDASLWGGYYESLQSMCQDFEEVRHSDRLIQKLDALAEADCISNIKRQIKEFTLEDIHRANSPLLDALYHLLHRMHCGSILKAERSCPEYLQQSILDAIPPPKSYIQAVQFLPIGSFNHVLWPCFDHEDVVIWELTHHWDRIVQWENMCEVLFGSIRMGHEKAVKIILGRVRFTHEGQYMVAGSIAYPMMYHPVALALATGHPEMAALLISHGCKPN